MDEELHFHLESRAAELAGSSLFTGDAGQGESNIRWIIESDWLEAMVALADP